MGGRLLAMGVIVKPKTVCHGVMKGNALSLALIMIAGSLAGCLASDSDGVPEISLTDEDITGLFDDYFMDFVNNSSVTVINEIHYHNNTTYVTNENNDITNNEGDSVTENIYQTDYINYSLGGLGNNSGNSDEILFVMHLDFNASEIAPDLVPRDDDDPRLRTFNFTKSFFGFVFVEGNNSSNNSNGNNGSNGWFEQQLINITHEISCSMYYQFEGENTLYIPPWGEFTLYGDGTFWGDNSEHYESNSDAYYSYWHSSYGDNASGSTSQMTAIDYYNAGMQHHSFCHPMRYDWVASNYVSNVGQIDVPYGYVLTGTVVEYHHGFDMNYFENNGNSSVSTPENGYIVKFVRESGMMSNYEIHQYGGWDNLTVMIDLEVLFLYENSEFVMTILYSLTPVIPIS